MANLKEMLKMNKKKSHHETEHEKDEILNNEEMVKTDKETEEPAEQEEKKEDTVEEKKEEVVEEKKEPTLDEKYSELSDRFLRLHAEFDNYRKRTIKERIDYSKYASEDILKSLLPVVDDMERAIKSMEDEGEHSSLCEGINLIYSKFKKVLSLKGVEEIKTIGETFNTDFHEAITNVPVEDEDMKGKVIDVVEKGYLLNGKVIRFAKVVVGN